MLFVSFLQVGFFAAAAAGLDLASLQYLSGCWAPGCREARNLGLAEVVVRSIGVGCLCLQLSLAAVRRRAVRCLGAWSRPARSFSGPRHQGVPQSILAPGRKDGALVYFVISAAVTVSLTVARNGCMVVGVWLL